MTPAQEAYLDALLGAMGAEPEGIANEERRERLDWLWDALNPSERQGVKEELRRAFP